MTAGQKTVGDLVRPFASQVPERIALLAPGRPVCSYGALMEQVRQTASRLALAGLTPADRVAVVLPNGPDMASAFVAVTEAATFAPLNPAYRAHEFEFFLQDLRARAVLVAESDPSAVRAVAARLEIPVFECRIDDARPAGCFDLLVPAARNDAALRPAVSSDAALVLHTSGTTARPKQVPLSHANLCASARNIARTLRLSRSDRCLNVMPLFHIHGLVAGVLATLASGGSVVATPGCLTPSFFGWLDEFDPTWYTAVPTMHQAVVARARLVGLQAPVGRLRFLRSSSAALPPSVMHELETLFEAPVIEAYGMTEAAHQMASNPLPPDVRKPGSVGRPAGSEVAIMNEVGDIVIAPDTAGEVVIRGDNVTSGYDDNPEANRTAFSGGWFRTGDQGYIDVDGYLYLTGRLKELINRGGEKIAPREIDDVLSAHPDVEEVLTFAVPDPRLGEEIGAAVVLRPGAALSSSALMEFAAERLADFKLPRRVVFVDELPKGPTGKLQRVGAATRLGLLSTEEVSSPAETGRTPSGARERAIAKAFAEVLELSSVSADANFFRLGGDSLLAVNLSSRIKESTGLDIPAHVLFEHSTPEALASYLDADTTGHIEYVGQGGHLAIAPLSGQQEFLWTIETLFRGTALGHRPGAIRIAGALDPEILQAAVDDLLARQPALRTTVDVPGRGKPLQQVVGPPRHCPVARVDLSCHAEGMRRERLTELARQLAMEPFDLAVGPLFRLTLVRLNDDEHVLLVNVHHIVFDGWSMGVLVSDLTALYHAQVARIPPRLQPIAVHFTDYAAWQRHAIDCGRFDGAIDYWRRRLHAIPPPFSPAGRQGLGRPSGRGQERRMMVPADVTRLIVETARAQGATPFMAYMAVFSAFCRSLGAGDDLVFGTFVSGRAVPQLTPLVGCLMNEVVIRIDLSGGPNYLELLGRMRQEVTSALAAQDVPLGHLIRTLRPRGGRFFDIACQLRSLPAPSAGAGDVTFAEMPLDWGLSRLDLLVEIIPDDAGIEVRFEFRDEDADAAILWEQAFSRALSWALDRQAPLAVLGGSVGMPAVPVAAADLPRNAGTAETVTPYPAGK